MNSKKENRLSCWCALLLWCCLSFSLKAQDVAAKATDVSPLLIGEKAPDLTVKTSEGNQVKLLTILTERPAVLIFYRGSWCPYCNTHLAELQGIEDKILELGYQIIAISPDSPDNIQGSIDKHNLKYKLLSDDDVNVAKHFGIAFTVPESSKGRLAKASDGINSGMLPVPSVFVLNKEGEILFEYINPDYKRRITASLLLSVLTSLKN